MSDELAKPSRSRQNIISLLPETGTRFTDPFFALAQVSRSPTRTARDVGAPSLTRMWLLGWALVIPHDRARRHKGSNLMRTTAWLMVGLILVWSGTAARAQKDRTSGRSGEPAAIRPNAEK